MAILGIDHVAIAVNSIEDAQANYQSLLETEPHYETVENQDVRLAVFTVGDSRIELLEPLGEENSITQFLEEHGEGVHHVALRTDDINGELDRARQLADLTCIDDAPREGAEGYSIAFLHPKDLSGTLLELAQPSHTGH